MYLSSNRLAVIVIALERFLHDNSVTAHTPSKQASSSLNQAVLKMSSGTPAAGVKHKDESGGADDIGFWSLSI
jgi:hypothetical protein